MTSRVFQSMHPRCAQCQREVDEVIEYYDQLAMQHVIIARCHGEEERAVITDQLLRSERHWSIGTVDAFQSKPIGALPKHEVAPSHSTNYALSKTLGPGLPPKAEHDTQPLQGRSRRDE